jgi:S1-C subfamily serine protease/ribosomal protein L40E
MFKLLTGTVVAAALALGMLAPAAMAAEASQQTADTVQPSITRINVTWDAFVLDDLTNEWTHVSFETQCSGFVADPDGYVVTAGHCLDPELAGDSAIQLRAKQLYQQNQDFFEEKGISLAQLIAYAKKNWQVEGRDDGSTLVPKAEVIVPSGDNSDDPVTYQAEVVDVDATNDVGLLHIDATGLPALSLADEDDIEIGESIFAVGFPGLRDSVTDPSLRPTFKSGSISDTGATRDQGDVPIYETSAPMSQGMSGGPTVNAEGEVVGINSFGTNLNNDFNWIAPSHLVEDMLEANDVDGALGQTDVLYRQALAAFYSDDFRTAAAKLQAVLAEVPEHPIALALVEEARENAQSQPLSDEPGPVLPLAPVGIAMAILATLGVSFLMGRTFARRMGHHSSPGSMAMAMPASMGAPKMPATPRPVPPRPVPPQPVPAPPTMTTPMPAIQPQPAPAVQPQPAPRTTPIGFQPPARAETEAQHRAFCTGCGTASEPDANFCRKCGTSVVI